jgi:flagellar hook-basal body complex protein FliE
MKASLLNPTPLKLTDTINNNKSKEKTEGNSFTQILQKKMEEANTLQKEANILTESFQAGGPVELHEVMLTMEKAEIALRLTVQIRNKLLEAYKEISQMQI